jgi:hypothetical protein
VTRADRSSARVQVATDGDKPGVGGKRRPERVAVTRVPGPLEPVDELLHDRNDLGLRRLWVGVHDEHLPSFMA